MTRFHALCLCYAVTAATGITAFQQPISVPTHGIDRCRSFSIQSLQRPLDSRQQSKLCRLSSTLNLSTSYQLEQKKWMFRDKYPIAYEVASTSTGDSDDAVRTVPILLLNGFGVGSFHQHRLMRQLLTEQQQQQQTNEQEQTRFIIYGIDYLGQGKSWPSNPQDGDSNDEYQLGYSADMWLDQLTSFVQEVILSPTNTNETNSNNNNKVHLVGNSVGGYLATILTHRHPHLISSLTLLNATPVWGLNLPGWDGKLPAPLIPKVIGRQMFDLIRNEDVIREYLGAAYVRGEAFDGTFVDGFDDDDCGVDGDRGGEPLGVKIRACTEGNGGHAAFASILWSAPASGVSFYDALEQVPVDVMLLFGGDDPWCTPAVGKRMHVTLASREDRGRGSAYRFVTLDNVGHCPNHEAPSAVARVLLPWLTAEERSTVTLDSATEVQEPWGEVLVREVLIEESRSLGLVDRVVSAMVG